MSDLITSDDPLTPAERKTLQAVQDTLVPASDDGRMPSAGELDAGAWIAEKDPDFLASTRTFLAALDDGFAGLDYEARHEALAQLSESMPDVFNQLLMHVYAIYYQDDGTLIGLGLRGGPLFPAGHTVEAGDLSLLDPVIAGRHRYRDA